MDFLILCFFYQIFKKISNKVAIESPGYRVARKVFELSSFEINDIPVNKDGLDLNFFRKKYDSKILYTTPSSVSNWVTMPIANRIKLINWAKNNDFYHWRWLW